ncbi:MAG: RNHCP domain-containing protein [Candidatus Paceibacterota bacterium]|nr:RNHCP domain-containing protein [Candidatus Paceibacterota bacterium]HPD55544.1 RNHCP domain-containing protein [Candidatus Paceibacterota bacterium]HQM34953.1 RNHCP domain-containing protein [Candidatus Paceibacterota bacterium]
MVLPTKKFQKKKESFICRHCGAIVEGNGYTDHCPHCLWSQHRDINPGDRKEKCHGLMKPVGVEIKKGYYLIYYQCQKCGYQFKVKAAKNDNFEEILKLSAFPF